MNTKIFWNQQFFVDQLIEALSVSLGRFALTVILFSFSFFIVSFGFEISVPVLQLQSKTNKTF